MRWMIYCLLALSPLPLASARPAWQWLWVSFVGLTLIVFVVGRFKKPIAPIPNQIKVSFGLLLAFVAWGYIQALAPFGGAHGFGLSLLDEHLTALSTLSVSPFRTVSVATFFLSHIAFAFLVWSFVSRRDRGTQLIRFCGIVGALYAGYGFIVFVSGNETILWYDKWANPNSLTSTFVNRNSYAAFAGIGLQCLIAYALYWIQEELAENRTGRELYRHTLETFLNKAWWLPLAIILTSVVVLLSNSRGGFGSVTIGVLALMLISPNRYQRRDNIKKTIAVYSILASIAVGLFALSGSVLEGRLQSDASASQRFAAYPLMIDAIEDRPMAGFGLGTFDQVFRIYRTEDVDVWFDRAHNDYLEVAMTAGVPATLLLLVAIFMAVLFLARKLQYGLQYRTFIALGLSVSLQLGLHSIVDFSLQMPAISYLWCAILAASLAMAQRCELAHKARGG